MKKLIVLALFLFAVVVVPRLGHAQNEVITGELISVENDMYTVKTDSEQGFRGARATFYVDSVTTKKEGDLKIGMKIQAEVDPNNGHAFWVKKVDPMVQPSGK